MLNMCAKFTYRGASLRAVYSVMTYFCAFICVCRLKETNFASKCLGLIPQKILLYNL